MLRSILILLIFIISGCDFATVKEYKSELDGTNYVTLNKTFIFSGVMFELSWNDKMSPNNITLLVDAMNVKTISQGESLHFNIDGTLYNLKSYDELPAHYTKNYNGIIANSVTMRYSITPYLINKIISAKKVFVRIDVGNEFIENDMDMIQAFRFTDKGKEFLETYQKYIK
jgi:hypothetical protein